MLCHFTVIRIHKKIHRNTTEFNEEKGGAGGGEVGGGGGVVQTAGNE